MRDCHLCTSEKYTNMDFDLCNKTFTEWLLSYEENKRVHLITEVILISRSYFLLRKSLYIYFYYVCDAIVE